MSDEFTPAKFYTGFWKWAGVGVFCLLLIASLIVGGWQAGWWFSNQNLARQTRQIQGSDSNQRALLGDLTSQVANVENATVQIDGATGQQQADLKAQRLGFARIACQDAEQITTPLRQGLGAWVKRNCTAGTVSPSSPLRK